MNRAKATAYVASKLLVPDAIRKLRSRDKVTVLALHRISDDHSLCWPPMPVAVFERLCRYWSQYYQLTTFRDLEQDMAAHQKPLLILSFDDGYLDFYQHAWPLLKKYGLKANVNIVTNCAAGGGQIWTQQLNNAFDALAMKSVHKSVVFQNGYFLKKGSSANELVKANRYLFQYLCRIKAAERTLFLNDLIKQLEVDEIQTPMMGWEQIMELDAHGIEIGCHTMTHDILTNIASQETLEYEIAAAKKMVEDQVRHPIDVLAFPNGFYNQEVVAVAKKSGFKYLLRVKEAFMDAPHGSSNVIVPRILLYHNGYYENKVTTENLFGMLRSYLRRANFKRNKNGR